MPQGGQYHPHVRGSMNLQLVPRYPGQAVVSRYSVFNISKRSGSLKNGVNACQYNDFIDKNFEIWSVWNTQILIHKIWYIAKSDS